MKRQSAAGGVAEIDALSADLKRLEQDRQMRADEAQAHIENLRRSIVSLEGELTTTRGTIARIQEAIDRHVIRAPVAGRIGETASLYAGAYVAEGQRLLSVVPQGELMIVGDFNPGSAMGRVRPGQRATMRLEGVPLGAIWQHRRDGAELRPRSATAPFGSNSPRLRSAIRSPSCSTAFSAVQA